MTPTYPLNEKGYWTPSPGGCGDWAYPHTLFTLVLYFILIYLWIYAYLFYETRLHYVAQAGLEVMILLALPPKC
jgi:hypothetical protein